MQFNSYGFILAFMPLYMIAYACLRGKLRLALIIAGSALFFAFSGWTGTAILAGSLLVNGLAAYFMGKLDKGKKKAVLGVAIALNVGLLLLFKYTDFILSSLIPAENYVPLNIIQPLGISYFTFQQIMYLVSLYRGQIDSFRIWDYLACILFFPKMVMGPMAEPADIIGKIKAELDRPVRAENLAGGLRIFSFGLIKKMLLADTFAKAVTWGFTNFSKATSMDLFLVMLSFTFQIYFDFSGYTDMAVGTAKMMGIDLPMNFNSPYKATSIRDFWKRWHLSLTGFFTRYVYIPLGGSRKGNFRTCLNILIIFTLSGLWHGANWTFLLWGAIEGVLSIAERYLPTQKKPESTPFRWLLTFTITNILMLLVRAESIPQWGEMLGKMFAFQDMSVTKALIKTFELPEMTFLFDLLHLQELQSQVRGFTMMLFLIGSMIIVLGPENNHAKLLEGRKISWVSMVFAAICLVWGIFCLGGESVFIYNAF